MERWALKFSTKDEFADFCLSLQQEEQAFTLVGSCTVVLREEPRYVLSQSQLAVLKKLEADGRVEMYPVPTQGKRRLPTAAEARELLRKFRAAREARISVSHTS